MEYTVRELAALAGVSPRTLRYYDQIGLLKPLRIQPNGYRVYGPAQVNALQEIRFFTELGFPLKEVQRLTAAPEYSRERALVDHHTSLLAQKQRIERLIANVEQTIRSQEGGTPMKDHEKFEGFKRELIRENEERYGTEIRKQYGDDVVDASNEKLLSMDEQTFATTKELEEEIARLLAQAAAEGDPNSPLAQRVCALHREWLCMHWPEGAYSKEAHLSLSEAYVEDPRFRQYYDAIHPGGAKFLHDALLIFCA